MITLRQTTTDPYFNLALEEYLLKEYPLEEDLFFVWRNTSSVIIGRNQNPFQEISLTYAYQNNIPILRRISGGGTVYHDLGNINFTYITTSTSHVSDYEYFLNPIIDVLNQLGLSASFVPKSHIYIGDKKISGNAQTFYKNKMIHHGTILFDMNLNHASNIIKKNGSVKGHFVSSRPAEIINIKEKLAVSVTIEELMDHIQNTMLFHDTENKLIQLNEQDIKRVEELVETKYKTFEWLYGDMKESTIEIEDFKITIKKGFITSCSVKALVGKVCDYCIVSKELDSHSNKETILKKIF